MKYPATLHPESGGFVVTFRDIPEAITQGDTEEEAMYMATDVLHQAIITYFDEARIVPLPSPAVARERLIGVPPDVAARIMLMHRQ